MSLGYDIKGWRGVAGNFEKKKTNGRGLNFFHPLEELTSYLLSCLFVGNTLKGTAKEDPILKQQVISCPDFF